ncbi:MAG: hydroxymethylglutaryl-CoA synthase family protein [Alphaproteobacteria bacterium]|nr:hydroxymethylglutaryl-CoA synthase family protein [Alphaproteobacteria bacterium]
MSHQTGIEKVRVFPGTLSLKIEDLCRARGNDFASVQRDLMTDERSLLAPWEDTVTMAVNATDGLLNEDELRTVELLIVATETAVDQEKPISSWVHRWLGLPSSCRNFEIKHACYGTTAALRMATAWLQGQRGRDCRALVVTADENLLPLNKPWEPITGACASAIVVSNRPNFLVMNEDEWGVFASEVTDVIRPSMRIETGNSETSLISYMDALEGAYEDFIRRVGRPVDFGAEFAKHIYHLPFAGMGLRAHCILASIAMGLGRKEAKEHFAEKVAPSLHYSRRIGSSFGSSIFLALFSLLDHCNDIATGDKLSIFSYGSGSCAEFYTAALGPHAVEVASHGRLGETLDERHVVTVEDYEKSEAARNTAIGEPKYTPDFEAFDGWFQKRYVGTGAMILDRVEDHRRQYRRA